ncbi:Retrovirus-related Pol polyprotein from transposon 297 [Vitis vinifera]|uniref:Retrovirus-related Pol polyprotein from transposon 297 n=1 Tax=Vitis vinifera TaxID=29760 RepID=A0A438CIE2_VITVI|nr:Retrovirus-related Pol polyprotein from transposon 297 [Vitis vinifera]
MDEEPQILLKEGMMKKHLPPPFPQALRGKKPIKNASEILDVLRQVKVNIPLLDMIKQVPTYAKFLKDLCTVKRGLNVTKQAFLTEQSILEEPKWRRHCLIWGQVFNLLPYSIYKELGLGELKLTSITLSLADRSVKIPRGVIEDVLVQVDKFYYPVDFVVLDTDPIVKGINYVPIILGRPFLATSNAIINCRNGVMQLTFGNMTLELNIFHLCQKHIHPEEDEGPEEVCMIDTLVEEHCNQSMLDQFEENPDESYEDLDDGLAEPMGMNVVMSNWRQKPVILPLFKDEEVMKEAKDAILKLELKTLPTELKYAYLEEGNKAPVVISSSLTVSQEDNLLRILRKHKKAIGWQIYDLKGISPLICTHHIYMEEGTKPTRQPQRRLNPHMQEVVRAEVLKLLQAGIIYPISDSTWVSPTKVVPKKKLNTVMRKDHFPLPFMDQVLERVSGHPFYCFLDGYSGYFQIEIDVEDQEKTTFTCPFDTYAYRRMPFGLCNAPATFQRCMLSIFNVSKRCIEKDLVLNWEKCHFMVNQGIVLGHVISKKGIEVDRAKVELIVKLPPPTNVKGIRQFLGHVGFYRRFIKAFSKIAKPLCELLVKDAKFEWDDKCQRSFELLKQFLTSTPIVRAPNWELPFETSQAKERSKEKQRGKASKVKKQRTKAAVFFHTFGALSEKTTAPGLCEIRTTPSACAKLVRNSHNTFSLCEACAKLAQHSYNTFKIRTTHAWYCNLCMPYWIRDQKGRLVRIENPQDIELDICINIMDPPPEDQNSQHGQGGNPNAYLSMRDRMHPPRMSAPSCIVPPLEQLVIRPHIVPLLPNFHGMGSENPYAHIKEFEEDQWVEVKISNFSAKENEKFHECWERYMEAINACPHHGFDTWLLVSYFYDGMSSSMKQILETMCGGDFMSKNPEEAMDFFKLCVRGVKRMG